MRILLLGEFSGLHKNLQIGLRAAGHSVDLASSGDGAKAIFGDITTPRPMSFSMWHRFKYRISYLEFIKNLKGYDIVQLVSPNVLLPTFFPYKKAYNYLRINNDKIFMLATGSDAFYWQKSRQKLRYGPFEDNLKYDLNKTRSFFETPASLRHNRYIAERVNGIIPTVYDYSVGYEEFEKTSEVIPLPIDVNSIEYFANEVSDHVQVFHGITRYGFKGTRHIEQAFRRLATSQKTNVKLNISKFMPLNEYLKTIRGAHIILDQVNSYSYGMNALYSMAMGKVTFSGCEPECLKALNIKRSPVVNMLPDAEDIVQKILYFLSDPNKITEVSEASRQYVEKNHCCHVIAQKYLEIWGAGKLTPLA